MLDDFKNEQPIAYKILKKTIKNNKLSHAYLFETNNYNNSKEFIISFAKTLLCPHNYTNNNLCKECHICEKIDKNIYSELKIIEPDGMWIKKEQLIELQNSFKNKSVEANKKVYIINHVEKLNKSSANSILKFLEEPEDNIIAILATDNVHQLLDTIISRCQIISLAKSNDLSNKTESEKVLYFLNDKIDDIDNIITDTIDFIFYVEQYHLKTIVYNKKLVLDKFETKQKLEAFFEIMILFYKDVLNYILNNETKIFSIKDVEKIKNKNSIDQISRKIKCIIEAKQGMKININSNLLIDKLVMDLEGDNNE